MVGVEHLENFIAEQVHHLSKGSVAAIDSRILQSGQVFFCLPGRSRHGREYIDQVEAAGGAAVVAEQPVATTNIPMFVVPNVLEALQYVAKTWRQSLSLPMIAVTGSCGKTTTRHFIETILSHIIPPILGTSGNYNNHIGVPLTLLALRSNHQAAVLELGANHLGEIEQLTEYVQPSVGVITNAAPVHIEGFGSVAGVQQAKGELFRRMLPGGTAIINANDPYAVGWEAMSDHLNVMRFGKIEHNPTLGYSAWQATSEGGQFDLHYHGKTYPVEVAVMGEHQQQNICAAICACLAIGMDIGQILAVLSLLKGFPSRLELKKAKSGILVIDDTYNANPAAYTIALDVLMSYSSARKWLVFADMAELGTQSCEQHNHLANQIKALGLTGHVAFGEQAQQAARDVGLPAFSPDSHQEAVHHLQEHLLPGDVVLVKGSRSMAMEKVVEQICY